MELHCKNERKCVAQIANATWKQLQTPDNQRWSRADIILEECIRKALDNNNDERLRVLRMRLQEVETKEEAKGRQISGRQIAHLIYNSFAASHVVGGVHGIKGTNALEKYEGDDNYVLSIQTWRNALLISHVQRSHPRSTASLTTTRWLYLALVPA